MKRGLLLGATLILAACSHPAVIITGLRRPSISEDQVKIFLEEPKTAYELVGSIDIEQNPFFTTKQGDLDRALASARKEAAKVGANGVLVLGHGRVAGGSIGLGTGLGNDGSLFSSRTRKDTHLVAKIINVQ